MPRLVSRNGFTLIDTRSEKLLDRYNLKLADLLPRRRTAAGADRFRAGSHGARRSVPVGCEATTKALESLRRYVAAFDPTLEAALDKSKAKILYQLTKNRAKVARGVLRRDEHATARCFVAVQFPLPAEALQERLYSIVPFLAQYGPDLVDRLYENVHMDCPDHVLLPIT